MIYLPDTTQRISIVGRTGSGKTQAGVWHLSNAAYDRMPYVVWDFKGDKLIAGIPGIREVGVKDKTLPKKAGIYVIRPLPNEVEEVQKKLWSMWAREDVGMYVDEGYMLGNQNPAFDAILTQGRSKNLPVIVLSQRPVWMSRFVFSESDFYQVFHLNDKRDRKTVEQFLPPLADTPLPPYHSYYYDVARHQLHLFKPVPKKAEIYQTFEDRQAIKHRRFWLL